MLREVTLYTTQKKRVLAGDYVEMFRYGPLETPYRITDTNQFVCGEIPKETVEVLQLPVHTLCEDRDGVVSREYLAVDPTIRRLIAAEEDRANTQESHALYWQSLSDAYRCELSNLKKMTFLQKLIFAFTSQKETK